MSLILFVILLFLLNSLLQNWNSLFLYCGEVALCLDQLQIMFELALILEESISDLSGLFIGLDLISFELLPLR